MFVFKKQNQTLFTSLHCPSHFSLLFASFFPLIFKFFHCYSHLFTALSIFSLLLASLQFLLTSSPGWQRYASIAWHPPRHQEVSPHHHMVAVVAKNSANWPPLHSRNHSRHFGTIRSLRRLDGWVTCKDAFFASLIGSFTSWLTASPSSLCSWDCCAWRYAHS